MKRTTACENPFMGKGGAHGCGQCLPCRLKKRREWTHRIMLEAGLYADNAFITLTYSKDPHSLLPEDHRNFLKRLRRTLAPLRVRFYGVGEYGDANQRPHYHYALFGYPSCRRGAGRSLRHNCCGPCDVLAATWGKGFIYNLPLEVGSARYIARYVIKKMTRFDDPRLGNRHPEFARMSLKPGVGSGILDELASVITRYNLLTPEGDVPVTLRHGSLQWPLGRYLRRQLRRKLNLDERSPIVLSADASFKNFHENEAMQAVWQAALSDPAYPSLKHHLLLASKEQRDQIRRRNELFGSKGKL